MAAPPDSTKVNPDVPINSARTRRNRWSGFVQSAKYRAPPTLAMSACSPCRTAADSGRLGPALIVTESLPLLLRVRVAIGDDVRGQSNQSASQRTTEEDTMDGV